MTIPNSPLSPSLPYSKRALLGQEFSAIFQSGKREGEKIGKAAPYFFESISFFAKKFFQEVVAMALSFKGEIKKIGPVLSDCYESVLKDSLIPIKKELEALALSSISEACKLVSFVSEDIPRFFTLQVSLPARLFFYKSIN